MKDVFPISTSTQQTHLQTNAVSHHIEWTPNQQIKTLLMRYGDNWEAVHRR